MPPIRNNPFSQRIHKLQKKIPAYQVDGIILFNISNIRYLSGFTGSDGVLVINPDNVFLLVDGRYTVQASEEAQGISVIQYQNKIQGISQNIKKMHLQDLGFEASFINVDLYNSLTEVSKKTNFIPLVDELRMLRACKDVIEIDIMKKAASIASEAINNLACAIHPGWTEQDAALHLDMTARRSGAEQVAFETIVASGENAALPHAKPTNRRIRKGDFVVIDFGVKYMGYCSDETCTFAIGELTRDQKNAYRAVQRAHDQAIASIKAGMAATEVDKIVRSVLGKKYGRHFVHGTGHGVGLEVHEAPRLAPNSKDVLEAGMAVTVEPGVYYPGQWGIRIEDTILVKKNGCEKITKMDKKLTIIE